LNGIQVSNPVQRELKMTNFQDEEAPAKQQQMLKKFENSITMVVAKQSISS
jgi:hypothetical protein